MCSACDGLGTGKGGVVCQKCNGNRIDTSKIPTYIDEIKKYLANIPTVNVQSV